MVTTLFGNNIRRVIFLLVVGVFVSMGGAFADPPVNDACDNAFVVTPGVAISGQALNNEATFAPDDPEFSCVLGPGFGSVFFEFVATYTSARVRTDLNSVALDSDFAVYAVDQINYCDKSLWTEVGCSEDGEFEFNGDICIEGLTIGDTYKIMLVSFTEGSSGEYTLQIDSPCPGQASGDADGDGVPDASDQCPATPANETVDANGCSATQLDDDGDGINNAADQCPNTPSGETVDATGCPNPPVDSDADGDGVIDDDDNCPNVANPDQADCDGDGIGDVCDTDDSAPIALAKNITVQLDATGNASIIASQVDNGSNDTCSGVTLSVSPDTFGCTNIGVNTVILTVTDGSGNSSTATAVVTVEGVTPPTVTASAFHNYLWPANHKMHQIFWTGAVTDNCDGSSDVVTICSVTSNEDENGWNAGDGNTWNDISWDDDGNLFLRAERAARGDGRVYTITVCSKDASGNITGSTTFTVEVPYDSGSHSCDDPNCDLNASSE